MKKYIEVSIETLQAITNGRRIEGSLGVDESTGSIAFKPYNRKPKKRSKNRLLCYLEHGWVKESPQRIKIYESLPKRLGAVRMAFTLDRESRKAAGVILDADIQ